MSLFEEAGLLAPGFMGFGENTGMGKGAALKQHWGELQGCSPAGISHDPIHQVEVHQPEARDRRLKVEINHVVLAHAAEILRVAHPGEGIYHLVVSGQLVEEPAACT